jgi:hypothetical protein
MPTRTTGWSLEPHRSLAGKLIARNVSSLPVFKNPVPNQTSRGIRPVHPNCGSSVSFAACERPGSNVKSVALGTSSRPHLLPLGFAQTR